MRRSLALILTVSALALLPISPAAAAGPEIFVAATGSDDTGDGTMANPYATVQKACNDVVAGTTTHVWVRGGTYTNDGTSPAMRLSDKCSGTPAQRITVAPYQDEPVVIDYDGNIGVAILADYVDVVGFEVVGGAQEITLDEVLETWWSDGNDVARTNGNGMLVDGIDVTVRGNVIHDTPGAGINTNSRADGLWVLDNLIYNASWWSTKGTTGIGMVSIDDMDSERVVTMSGNVVLRAESRVFSHVFGKGFVTLDIDEGSSILVKAATDPENPDGEEGTYGDGYLIHDNLFAFNGKGVSLRGVDIDFHNNTMYGNGTTMASTGAGVRSQGATRLNVEDNLISAAPGKEAIDIADSTTWAECAGNLLRGDEPAPVDPCTPANGNAYADRAFVDGARGDLTASDATYAGAGVDPTVLAEMMARIEEAQVSFAPTGWCVDTDELLHGIEASLPEGATLDKSDPVRWHVDLPPGNPTGEPELDLEFRTKTGPDRIDLCGAQEDTVYQGTMPIRVNAHDAEHPISSVQLLVNGEPWGLVDTEAPYEFSVPTPRGSGGFSIASRVVDAETSADSPAIDVRYANPPVKVASGLTIRKAQTFTKSRRTFVSVGISKRASGKVQITVSGNTTRTRRFSKKVDISSARGRASLRKIAPKWAIDARNLRVKVRYPGDADTRAASAFGKVVKR